MNDSEFMDSFLFKNYRFKTYRYSDNREGAQWHYFVYMLAGQAKIVTDSDTVEIREGGRFLYSHQMQLPVVLVQAAGDPFYLARLRPFAEPRDVPDAGHSCR